MNMLPPSAAAHPHWNGIYRNGAVAALAMLAIMAAQIGIYIAWPPPDSVPGFFALFQSNWLLGLLSMDLLYILNNTLLVLIYLALYAALKPAGETAVLIALVLGLIGITAYYASNTAFEMLSLSRQYAAAATETQRIIALAAGEAMLATYKGTVFDTYYILNGITLLIFAAVMLRSPLFSRTTAIIGLAAGVLMSIPSTAGTLGLVFSLLSLIPWAVFCILLIKPFFQLEAKIAAR